MELYKAIDALPSRANKAAVSGALSSPLLLILLMMLGCAGVSFFFLQGQSLRLDEAQSLWESGRSARGVITIVAEDVHVPLYHELLRLWRLNVGNTVAAARALSLVFFLLAVPGMYMLGKKAYGWRIGLFAALLLSLSPFMNWFGNEIRMYTLFALVAIINQYCFISILQGRKKNSAAWLLYALSALCGIYTHYFFFVGLAAQAFFYFLHYRAFPKRSLVKFTGVCVLLAASFAPWVWYVVAQGEIRFQEPLLPRPTTIDLFNSFSQFLFGFQDNFVNTVLVSLWPLCLLFAFLALRKKRDISLETAYFLTAFAFSVASLFFASLILQPIFISRYLIFVVPSLYLLIANFLSNYPARLRAVSSAGLACLMLLTLAIEVHSPATPVKENYEEAMNFINAGIAPQDVLIVSAPFTLYPVEYYYRGAAPISTLPIWNQYAYGPIPPFEESELPAQVASTTANYQEAWVLLSYNQGYESDIKSYFDENYSLLESKVFSDDLTLYVYKLRYDTPLSVSTAISSGTRKLRAP